MADYKSLWHVSAIICYNRIELIYSFIGTLSYFYIGIVLV